MDINAVSGQYSLESLENVNNETPKTPDNKPYVDNQKVQDIKDISGYQVSDPETNREIVGGKSANLEMMAKCDMPVPKTSNIPTQQVAKFEQYPIEASILKHFFSSYINEDKTQLDEFFAYLAKSNTNGCNLISVLTTIKGFFKEDATQQKQYISAIEAFIKDEQFYNIVKDLPVANKIRKNYDDLINKLPANSSIIVRSSGVKEDNFGDAQAGKFESIVHKNIDIITTCLGVLASKYQPAVCQSIEPQGMALTLNHYIPCVVGGVVMSARSLADNKRKIEFGPNHQELISGKLGITPHSIICHQSNTEENPIYDIIKTENLAYTEIPPEALKQLLQHTSKLEDIFNAPVDIEFGIDNNGKLYLFQVRPITKLAGGMNFATTAPNDSISNGRLISEGICSGKMVYVSQQQEATNIPQGAIIVAKAYQEWMLDPDFLNKVAGFIFEQGGDNDHVAITLRQANKPYMVAGDQFESLNCINHKDITLVCGSFNGTEGAYVVKGNELFQQLSSTATVDNSFAKCLSPANKTKIDTNFDRPDTGFQCLHELNHRLLEYFSANSWLSNCFSDKGYKALSIDKNRAEIIKQAKAEMNEMFVDLDQFITAYERFLNLGMNGDDTKEIKAKLVEVDQLKASAQTLKMNINRKINNIEAKLTTDVNLNAPVGSYEQYLKDCKDILTMTQELTVSKSVNQVNSIQNVIVKIHAGFIEISPIIAMNSGLGDRGVLNKDTNSQLINLTTNREQKNLAQNIINAIEPLSSQYETKIIVLGRSIMVEAKLGVHACTIEMIEDAEGGKGRLLRLKLSDDFTNLNGSNYVGKLKRFWLLSQVLHNLNIDKESAGMQASVSEATGILTVEVPLIKTKQAMQLAFTKMVKVVANTSNLDIKLNTSQLNQPRKLWNFSLLQEKLRTLSSKENQDELFCVIFMLAFFSHFPLSSLKEFIDEKNKLLLKKIPSKYQIKTITDLEAKCCNIPEIKEHILYYLLLNSPMKYVPLLQKSKYAWWLQDKTKVIDLVSKSETLFQCIASEWGNDKEVVLAAVNNNATALRHASEKFKEDRDIVLAAIKNNASILKIIDNKFKQDRDIILLAVHTKGSTLIYASDQLKNDKEVVLAAVHQNGEALQYASDQFKNDKEVVLATVYQNGMALQYASDQLKNDKEIVLAAAHQNGMALQYTSEQLKNDKEVILATVHQNGLALKSANHQFRDDKEVVLVAISNNRSTVEYMNENFKSDRDIMLAFMRYEQGRDIARFFHQCSITLQNDVNFIIDALKINTQILNCIPYNLRQDKRIIDYLEKSRVKSILKVDTIAEPEIELKPESEPYITPVPDKQNVSFFKKILMTLSEFSIFLWTKISTMIVKLFTFISSLFIDQSKKDILIEEVPVVN
jgi:phosphohistidine swiveling domain-containing protein